jgi:cyclic pyranopterin phosphate synthase
MKILTEGGCTELEDNTFTHFNEYGKPKMVDVTPKQITSRVARARGYILMKENTKKMIIENSGKKGDVIYTAQIAGIMGAKKTSELIPMCHQLPITSANLKFWWDKEEPKLWIESEIKVDAKTGVEMEAFVAVSVAQLTVYDMCKAVDRSMVLGEIKLMYKNGGKSGEFKREDW